MPDVIDSFTADHEFLSNFYEHNGWTVEHHYQAAKTDDAAWRARILNATTPADAKAMGRLAPIRPGWDNIKIDIMRTLLYVKFGDPDLAKRLVATEDVILVEGNHHNDTFWGQVDGVGDNHLGKILMEVRRSRWIVEALQTIETLAPNETLVVTPPISSTELINVAPTDVPHGTITRYYNYNCRCEECEDAITVGTTPIQYDGQINPRSGYVPNGRPSPTRPKPKASIGRFGLAIDN